MASLLLAGALHDPGIQNTEGLHDPGIQKLGLLDIVGPPHHEVGDHHHETDSILHHDLHIVAVAEAGEDPNLGLHCLPAAEEMGLFQEDAAVHLAHHFQFALAVLKVPQY